MHQKELIEKTRNTLIELAKLQKPDLEDTSELRNYNLASAQIIKIRALLNHDIAFEKILPIAESLQKKTLAELKSELPKMIAIEQMTEATQRYQELQTHIQEMVVELQRSRQIDEPSRLKP